MGSLCTKLWYQWFTFYTQISMISGDALLDNLIKYFSNNIAMQQEL